MGLISKITRYTRSGWILSFSKLIQRIWNFGSRFFYLHIQSPFLSWSARRELSDKDFLGKLVNDWESVAAFLEHLAKRPTSSFLLPHESPQETSAILISKYPDYYSNLLSYADAICQNEINIFEKTYSFSGEINWHADPVTKFIFPNLHSSKLARFLWSSERSVDIRFVWELNRHHHFVILGIAYWLTGNEKYVHAFNDQLLSWIKTNPLDHGINWQSSLDISIRLIAWTTAFQFFRGSLEFREKAGNAFLKSLWQQANFLSANLQTSSSSDVPNNHIIGELAGLMLIGMVFPEFRSASSWRKSSLPVLIQQLRKQTYSDGVNKEQAMSYHRFVAEFLVLIIVGTRHGLIEREPIFEQLLEQMLDYIMFSTTPDKTVPMWGDADNARVLNFSPLKDFWDFRSLLSTGAVLFKRSDLKYSAGFFDEESYWLLGHRGVEIWESLLVTKPKSTSRSFPDAGLYVIRDGWEENSDTAFFRCGPFGLGGEGFCAHAHCDLLSIQLWIKGLPLLVDSGTYAYHGSWRNSFRISSSHNTIKWENYDQAVPKTAFNWEQVVEARCIDWSDRSVVGELSYFSARRFIRSITYIAPGNWILKDKLIGIGEFEKINWSFHFAPNLSLNWNDELKKIIVSDNNQIPFVEIFPPKNLHIELGNTWYSHSYGQKEQIASINGFWEGKLSADEQEFSWKIMASSISG